MKGKPTLEPSRELATNPLVQVLYDYLRECDADAPGRTEAGQLVDLVLNGETYEELRLYLKANPPSGSTIIELVMLVRSLALRADQRSRASSRNKEAREWVQREWLEKESLFDSKNEFARKYSDALAKGVDLDGRKLKVEVTPQQIATRWLPKASRE